jgi:cytochrome c-type biogenesis protein CcmE
MEDTSMPDLLQHEAQAILTGELGEDGIFRATELNLKCPTRFEEHSPEMLAGSMG